MSLPAAAAAAAPAVCVALNHGRASGGAARSQFGGLACSSCCSRDVLLGLSQLLFWRRRPPQHSQNEENSKPYGNVVVRNFCGEELKRVEFGTSDTATKILARLEEPFEEGASGGPNYHRQLVWRGTVLRSDDILIKVGVGDGDSITLVRTAPPAFELATRNAELSTAQDTVWVSDTSRSAWGWAAAFTSSGARVLTVRLGATAPLEADVTDYFVGVLPEEYFDATSVQNFLGDHGVGLVLSSYSNWSGSLKVRGRHHSRPFGARKFYPGDAITVELDPCTGFVRFAHGGEWCDAVNGEFGQPPVGARLGVSLYCATEPQLPVRSVTVC